MNKAKITFGKGCKAGKKTPSIGVKRRGIVPVSYGDPKGWASLKGKQ